MSIYSVKGKGWRYDFTLNGKRHTGQWFRTKSEARMAEAARRKEGEEAVPEVATEQIEPTLTGISFLELVNQRLDFVKAYRSHKHYQTHVYHARRWVKHWGKKPCEEISRADIQKFVLSRARVSAHCANQEIRYLRATFNWGIKNDLIQADPTKGMEFLPVEKRLRFVPTPEEIDQVMAVADPDTQDYLWAIKDTMGRMSEINRLTWEDVNLEQRFLILYTRKKRGGSLTPRKVYLTKRLFSILDRRFRERDKGKPWVFWHTYWSSKTGEKTSGPYTDRKKVMRTLCKKAGVKYFRFHALRHAGASQLDQANIPLGTIQKILGHENRTTTEIYLHSIGKMEREAMAVLDRLNQNSHTDSHTETRRRLRLVT